MHYLGVSTEGIGLIHCGSRKISELNSFTVVIFLFFYTAIEHTPFIFRK